MPPAAKSAPAPAQDALYPVIEAFVEKATAEQIGVLYQSITDGLAGLKGPQAANGKKIEKAVEKTTELLSHLIQVREKLEADRKGKRK